MRLDVRALLRTEIGLNKLQPNQSPKNSSIIPVTFSRERLRNGVEGYNPSSKKPKEGERKNMKSQNTVTESKSGRIVQYAKRIALTAPGKLLLAVAVMIGLVSIPLLTRANQTNEKRQLTGNWMLTVTPVTSPPGLAPSFLGLLTFFDDGNLVEESNTTAIRGTGRGHWEKIGHEQFTFSFVSFRFDAARTYLGTGRITATITLSEDGSALQGDAVVQNFDASGNLLITLQVTEVGQRL